MQNRRVKFKNYNRRGCGVWVSIIVIWNCWTIRLGVVIICCLSIITLCIVLFWRSCIASSRWIVSRCILSGCSIVNSCCIVNSIICIRNRRCIILILRILVVNDDWSCSIIGGCFIIRSCKIYGIRIFRRYCWRTISCCSSIISLYLEQSSLRLWFDLLKMYSKVK